MLYYSGKNVTWIVALILTGAFTLLFIRVFNPSLIYPDERMTIKYEKIEKIIGYSIDEMRSAATDSTFYDTVAVIYKKDDSIFIRSSSSYNFKRKDSITTCRKKNLKPSK